MGRFAETLLHLRLKTHEFWIAVSTELRSSGWLKLNLVVKNNVTSRLNGVEKFRVAETFKLLLISSGPPSLNGVEKFRVAET